MSRREDVDWLKRRYQDHKQHNPHERPAVSGTVLRPILGILVVYALGMVAIALWPW